MRSKNVNGVSDWSAERSTTTASASGVGAQVSVPRNLRAVDATAPDDGDPPVDVPAIKLTWSGVSGATAYAIMMWDNTDACGVM